MDSENNPQDPVPQGSPEPAPEAPARKREIPTGLIRVAASILGLIILTYIVAYEGLWKWGLCRVYVGPGETLVVNSKFGKTNPNPLEMRVVPDGYQGIRERVYGEGRHFFNPITYDKITDEGVMTVPPGKIGLVESKSGKALPDGEFLAEAGYKGIQRKVLTPGRWRLNPVAYEVTSLPATIIKPGFVGCVTSLAGKPSPPGKLAEKGQRGILEDVLTPGIYYLNPREYKVDVVEIGYRQISLKGVQFPSKDGFDIKLDISVVWGLEPMNVPQIINNFGNVQDVVTKVISPQVESICRIEGSKYGAKEFIEGKTREEFQLSFTSLLEAICREKNI
ncbi:MAG: SPFH domain-containing protein, partial [Planctomycetota bacterium]